MKPEIIFVVEFKDESLVKFSYSPDTLGTKSPVTDLILDVIEFGRSWADVENIYTARPF